MLHTFLDQWYWEQTHSKEQLLGFFRSTNLKALRSHIRDQGWWRHVALGATVSPAAYVNMTLGRNGYHLGTISVNTPIDQAGGHPIRCFAWNIVALDCRLTEVMQLKHLAEALQSLRSCCQTIQYQLWLQDALSKVTSFS